MACVLVLFVCIFVSSASLHSFSWEKLVDELRSKAPTLHSLLSACAEVKRRERGTKGKKIYRTSPSAVVGVCASILLRNRNQSMNVLQYIVSLILHRGHAGKQVKFTNTHVYAGLFQCMYISTVGVSTAAETSTLPLS